MSALEKRLAEVILALIAEVVRMHPSLRPTLDRVQEVLQEGL